MLLWSCGHYQLDAERSRISVISGNAGGKPIPRVELLDTTGAEDFEAGD